MYFNKLSILFCLAQGLSAPLGFALNQTETANFGEAAVLKHHSSLLNKSTERRQGFQLNASMPKYGCRAVIDKSRNQLNTRHETYKYFCAGIEVYQARKQLHYRDGELLHQSNTFPESWLQETPPETWPERSEHHLYELPPAAKAIWLPTAQGLSAAWKFVEKDQAGAYEIILDASTGMEIFRRAAGFHATGTAKVFPVNRQNGNTETTDLSNLIGNGFLDGKRFSVFSDSEEMPRPFAEDLEFVVSPNDEILFQQLQSYANLEKAASWFADTLGFEWAGDHLNVYTNMLVDGYDPDNAAYYPASDTGGDPEIHFGRGDFLRDLAIDADVATHELSHHIIYQFIDDKDGDAGVLHEGTADYFTYSMNGDPNLAESVLQDKDFLRTAELADSYRFDNPYLSGESHKKGQIWAAFLWQLQLTFGSSTNQLVSQALHYLNGHSSIAEALAAILQSVEDLNLAGAANNLTMSPSEQRCIIVDEAIHRGMAQYLQNEEAVACGIDLDKLQQEHQENTLAVEEQPTRGKMPTLFGQSCGSIAGAKNSHTGLWIILLSMLFGLFLRPRAQRFNSSRH